MNEGDPRWIEGAIARAASDPMEPYAGVGHALKSLRARGATDDELTDLVRGMQAEVLFHFCYLLDQTDEDGQVLGNVEGLHESVLETDPTGREMRPRPGAG